MTASGLPPASVTVVGNATTILRIGGFTLLTDPNFLPAGHRAYLGYGVWTRRRADPALTLAELPPLDAVLLSHLHGDHFDRVARRGLARHLTVLAPPAAQRRLRQWGFRAATGLGPWASHELVRGAQLLRVTATPAYHGPRGLARLLPPTMGAIVELERDGQPLFRLYVSGDTLYRPGLAEIPRRYPEVDAMLLHLGGARALGVPLSMDGRQGNLLTRLIRPRVTVPLHYHDYPAYRSPLGDYLREATRNGSVTRLLPLRRGETAELPVRARSG
ncbi:MBL fold metallo-hydrolase [Phytohabitans sp. ZYX-F-186]|uniref:MBL fold metallo-hydrolase n=1 Tax=Phytohabitans maris TaxID=3071409 RepID=A0ABU0ZGY2_9ACTN|nr:MBL fold metallo-hydrolase [Phytohabitans sp. ZYX-F-186]MDQ7906297.1 MBL fold metallo-hydrolase [Phytohabitans sp. ZYX-F-186]